MMAFAGRRARGFTLIEVLVALAVIAVALGAVLRATGQIAAAHDRLVQQQIASWCAENAFAELRLAEPLPAPGERSLRCEQLGIGLDATLSVLPTPNPNFRRLQISFRNSGGEPLLTLTAIAGGP
jgi:general secretion pathway protein I